MKNLATKLPYVIPIIIIAVIGFVVLSAGQNYLAYTLMTVIYLILIIQHHVGAARLASKAAGLILKLLMVVYIVCMAVGASAMFLFHDALPAGLPENLHSIMFYVDSLLLIPYVIITLVVRTGKSKPDSTT